MTHTTPTAGDLPPGLALDHLLDRHGIGAVLRALAAAILRRRRKRRDAGTLPDHLRRDIGLPEQGGSAPRMRGPWM
ncbi:hypothetical protein [Maritimibacter sp. HL-12]|uniref:hypothetical protein n=1 Tax=Maritimibacter sp. HL-12 TaxID=1162418 RepID=UPI000A0F3970|nr:hypothetical protein [Maritimibacter sp. HL-12]SMH49728.1 hypothetical protein SAMN05661107_2195 [Maritimibacter sp. HL-12]